MHSLNLFTREVMPRLAPMNEAAGQAAPALATA
jgi:hypothetical protein